MPVSLTPSVYATRSRLFELQATIALTLGHKLLTDGRRRQAVEALGQATLLAGEAERYRLRCQAALDDA